MQGQLGPRDLSLNKLGKGPLGMQCYIPNFKHLRKVLPRKKIFVYFTLCFYGKELLRSQLGPCGLDFNVFGKRPLGNANFKHLGQVALKKKFFNIFYVFLWFNLGPPEGAILGPGTFV